jgi:hypothetical protein
MGATRRKVRNSPELRRYTWAKAKQQRSAALILITGIQPLQKAMLFGSELWVSATASLRQLQNRQAACIKAIPSVAVAAVWANFGTGTLA